MELNKLKDIATATLLRLVNEYQVDLTWSEERQRYTIQHYPHAGMETLIIFGSQGTLVEVNGEGNVMPYLMVFRINNGKLQEDLPKILATIEQIFPKESREDIIEKVLDRKGLECTSVGIYKSVENYPREGIKLEFIDMTCQCQIRVSNVDETPMDYPITYSIPTKDVPNHKFEGSIKAQLKAIEFMFGE